MKESSDCFRKFQVITALASGACERRRPLLPFRVPADRSRPGPTSRPRKGRRFGRRTPASEAGPLHILVVEDDCDYSVLVRRMLETEMEDGVEVACVESLAGAREHLDTHRIDCLVLDLGLPDAQGLEALEELHGARRDFPTVVLTGTDDDRLALRAFQIGVEEYLVKDRADAGTLARSIGYAIERRRAQLELNRLALHDALTGLPNRTLFLDRLALALARAHRESTPVALLFLDLDGFKGINDRLGHDAGDHVLVEVARRMAAAMRPGDTVARMGGDEFTVVCEGVGTAREATPIADRLSRAIAEPIDAAGETIALGTSIGIAIARSSTPTPAALLREADAAMYRAKRRGGASIAT
jgi:diguanylate cyclase (GGDEF)-like protein